MAARYGLVLSVLAGAGAIAGQLPPTPPSQVVEAASDAAAPDEDFIEFLGGDDVGDAAWWEFLKNAAPRKEPPAPVPPPQDAKP